MAEQLAHAVETGESSGSGVRRRWNPQWIIWGVVVLLVGIPAATNPSFRSLTNLQGLAQTSSVLIMVAMGQAIVLLLAGVDLSVGALMALGSVVIALALGAHWPLVLAIIIMMAVVMALGTLTGIGVGLLKIPSFITSFGMMGVAGAIALVLTKGQPIALPPTSSLPNLAYNRMAGIPEDFIFAIMVMIALSFVVKYFAIGRHVYAVGSNRQAARLAGVRVERTLVVGFLLSALFAGLGAIVYASQVMSGNPIGGTNLNLESIAAAVIGGVSLFGGQGRIVGAFVGAVVYSLIINVLNVYGINSNIAELASGFVIIGAAYVSVLGQKGGESRGR